MKKLLLLFTLMIFVLSMYAQVTKTLNIAVAGTLSTALTPAELTTINNLTLTGTIDARDFKTMRDNMTLLSELDLSGINIVAYSGTEGPYFNTITAYPVNTVPYMAFIDNKNLKSIILPLTATSIGSIAFYGCSSLISIHFPPSITSIQSESFSNCSGLTSIFIPSTLKTIGNYAFSNCGLITVDTNNPNYSSIDGVLFNKNVTKLIQYPVIKNGDYAIPSTITSIGPLAFYQCYGLTAINIPSNVSYIGEEAFYECSKLTTIIIPSSVSNIKASAFSYCTGLSSIYVFLSIPIDLSSSQNVFSNVDNSICKLYVPYGCSSLYSTANQWKNFTNIMEMNGFHLSETTLNLESEQGSTKTIDLAANVNWTANSDQTWLTVSSLSGTGTGQKLTFTAEANPLFTTRTAKVIVSAPGIESQVITITQNKQSPIKTFEVTPGSLSSLSSSQLTNITNLTLTGTIDARDFKIMRDKMPLLSVLDLKGVNIAEYHGSDGTNVWWFTDYPSNTIPVSALIGKISLTSVILPSSMTSFGAYAFANCSGIKEISIPQMVSDIGSNTFDGCRGLKSVTIPSSVTNTGNNTFSGCYSLTSVIIPSSVITIGDYSFSYCIGLTSITIPSSVTSIGAQAFLSCSSLISVDIPTSVVSIGESAFRECNALTTFNIPPSVTRISSYTFASCISLKSVTIPPSVTNIGNSAFVHCSSLTSVTIPSSVASIGEQAFEACSMLTSVNFGPLITKIENDTFKNCNKLNSLTVDCSVPPSISSSAQYVFYNVDKNACILHVPYGTTSLYKAANQWKDFVNIVEPSTGFYISSHIAVLSSGDGSTTSVNIASNVEWIASTDQIWLKVGPAKGMGNQTLTFTAEANTHNAIRSATVTISSTGLEPQTITVNQNGSDIILTLSPGSLASILTPDKLNTTSNLVLSGSIDARDFKTMRDNMPQLTVLDLSRVNIAEYIGSGGTTIYGNNNYPANTIPEFAFYNGVEGKTSLSTIVFPLSVTSFGQKAFGYCSGLTSISVDWHVPIDLGTYSNVFIGWDKSTCTLNVPYGTASRYAVANQWKDFIYMAEAVKGFKLSSFSANIPYTEGTTTSVDLTSNIDWLVSSDQNWLVVSTTSGHGNQILTFTASANTLDRNRTSIVTVSGTGVSSQTIKITQNIQPQPIKTLVINAGELSLVTTEVLNTVSKLTLTGTIDARDFKTMRDKMPILAELDISGANIVAYNGSEGTSVWGNQVYPANTIPETAFLIKSPLNGDFSGKTSLKSIILPSSLLSLGYYAFMHCNGITNIVIPPSVTSIRDYAFFLCEGLTSVLIPSSVKSIESYAFGSCQSLTLVNIPSTVTSIGSNAFFDCKALASIIIPSSVTSIGSGAFGTCPGLASITVNWPIPLNVSSSNNIFYSVNKNTCILKVPYGTASRYAAANQWKEFIHIVEMPGFFLSETTAKLGYVDESTSKIAINSDVAWTVSSDQTWLSFSPSNGSGIGQELTLTASGNSLFTTRTAKVIVSAIGVESQTITVTQDGFPINLTPGGLITMLSVSELSNITKLTITGTIDARDFKTMRDKMPLLAELDLSGVNIIAYKGYEGTSLVGGNNDYPANAIPESAFYNGSIGKSTLTTAILPLSLTSIGQTAFAYCNGIRNIIIPSLVTSIGNGAFHDSQNLTSVYIPSSVYTIASGAFLSCKGLTTLIVGCSFPPDLRNSNIVFFNVNKSTCILHVPYGTTSRYATAYQWKDFLNIVEPTEGFNLSSNIVPVIAAEGGTVNIDITANINWTANSDQTWLAVSPLSGTGIGQKLTFTAEANPLFTTRSATVTISAIGSESQKVIVTQERKLQPPKTLDLTAGSLSSVLTTIELNTITDLTLVGTIDARDFKTMRDKMPLLSKLNLNEATIVAYNGSEGTSNWQNNDYPANTIPEFAFLNSNFIGKTSLTSVVFPSSMTSFGQYSFMYCNGIKDITIPSTVTTIGDYAFYNCAALITVNIPIAVKSIGNQSFGYLSGPLTVDSLNLNYSSSDGVLFNKAQTEIIQCPVSKTGSYMIPLSVTSIGSYAFRGCYGLTGAFVIPSSVTSIGTYSFYGCRGLTSISIPLSVTSIGGAAFNGCSGLGSIYAYPVSPINLEISKDVFYNVYKSTCTLYIPAGSKNIYQAANQWKDFTKIVELYPATVANAGPDQTINEGSLVTLDGSGSTSASNNALTYKWTTPAGITLSSETSSKPTFTAPEVSQDTPYTFTLVVNDGVLSSTADQVVITVKKVNKAPTANAGVDQTVNESALVSLDGTASSDASNNALTYKWAAPVGIILSSETLSKPTFTAPEVGQDTQYTITLIVNDGTLSSTADQVVITVKQVNKAPIANAGVDQTVNKGVLVSLDGTASSDPASNTLTYKWTAPAGIILSSETASKPTFTAPEVSQDTPFTFTLVVNDGTLSSPPSQIKVTVRQTLPVLNLTSKTNNLLIPVKEVTYHLFIKKENGFSEENLSPTINGDATQFSIEPGEWIVLASPVQNSTLFVPTYLGNVLNWDGAEHIIIPDKGNVFKEITCFVPENTNIGLGQISGYVYENQGNETKSISITKSLGVSGNPVHGALIRLFKKDGTLPIFSVFTDSQGYYKFDRLEITDYKVMVELPGFIQSENFNIILSNEEPLTTAYFSVNTTLQVITDNSSLLSSSIKFYPNPTIGVVNIIGLPSSRKSEIAIYTIEGKLIKEKTTDSATEVIDISDQISGTYIMIINKQTFKIWKK